MQAAQTPLAPFHVVVKLDFLEMEQTVQVV